MAISVFLSTVSDEFRAYRDQLRGDLTRHNVAVKVQEDFKDLGGDNVDKLDRLHRRMRRRGSSHRRHVRRRWRTNDNSKRCSPKHPDLAQRLPALGEALKLVASRLSYTHWEAWLALYLWQAAP